jgi:hypothetical protein
MLITVEVWRLNPFSVTTNKIKRFENNSHALNI